MCPLCTARLGPSTSRLSVEEGELRRIVTTTGTLNAIVNVEVGSQLSGQVAELPCRL